MARNRLAGRAAMFSPTLDENQPSVSIYSAGAGFVVAFFGGPVAIILFSGLDAARLGRLREDFWRYALLGVTSVVVMGGYVYLRALDPSAAWLTETLGDDSSDIIMSGQRIYALTVWLLLWLPYRRDYRAADTAGIPPRDPWGYGLICVFAGSVVDVGIQLAVYHGFPTSNMLIGIPWLFYYGRY